MNDRCHFHDDPFDGPAPHPPCGRAGPFVKVNGTHYCPAHANIMVTRALMLDPQNLDVERPKGAAPTAP